MPTVLNTLLGRRRQTASKRGKRRAPRKTQKRSSSRKGSRSPILRSNVKSASMRNDRLDVRSSADVSKLKELLKGNKIVLVLVYADWCGHCQTFKKDVWAPLSAMPNRKVPLAAVNESVLAETPVASAKIDGYPSVLMMGQDGRAAEFEGPSGEPTNAMPNARDLEAMKTIVAKDPASVFGSDPSALAEEEETVAEEEENEPRSLDSTPDAEDALNMAGEEAMNNLSSSVSASNSSPNASLSKIVSNPPDVEDDIASMQAPPAMPLNSMGRTLPNTASGAQEGGSLYFALLEAAKDVLPAAALAGAAVYVDRRTRRRRGSRRGASKKLRR